MPGRDSTFYQNFLLGDYGDSIASYNGRGILTLHDGSELNCKFEAGQMKKGDVLLLCEFHLDWRLLSSISAIRFDGTTSEGYRISCDNRIAEINYLPDLPDRTGVFAAFRSGEMKVYMTEGSIQTRSVRFGVTNFEFEGTDVQQTGNGECVLPLKLRSGDCTTEVAIRPLGNYEKIMRRIKTLKTIDVTCEVTSYLTEDGGLAHLKEAIDNLCHILSVARGTTIQWIYIDHYDAAAECVMRIHSPRITKPFSPSAIIDPRFDGRHETREFIEKVYGVFVSKRDSWGLNRGLIAAYLDAKAEQDYLEARGAKLAVAMEMMKSVFLKQPEASVDEWFVGEAHFEGVIDLLRVAIDKTLESQGIQRKLREAIARKGKIKSLNRRPFRHLMAKLCKSLGLAVSESDLALFVAGRDKLVHKGKFYCMEATEEERAKCPPLPSETDEYFFLASFVDRIFLKLLDYSGPYIDRRMPGNPARSQLV